MRAALDMTTRRPLSIRPRKPRKPIRLGGYIHSDASLLPSELADLFKETDAKNILSDVKGWRSVGPEESLLEEALSRASSRPKLARERAVSGLLRGTLGLTSPGGTQVSASRAERSRAFCTRLLEAASGDLSPLVSAVAYASETGRPADLTSALALLSSVCISLRGDARLEAALLVARGPSSSGSTPPDGVLGTLFSLFIPCQSSLAATLPLGKVWCAIDAVLGALLVAGSARNYENISKGDAGGGAAESKRGSGGAWKALQNGLWSGCGEWDLRGFAAQVSRRHTPVIVQEDGSSGELSVTTFATLPPAVRDALHILTRAANRDLSRRRDDDPLASVYVDMYRRSDPLAAGAIAALLRSAEASSDSRDGRVVGHACARALWRILLVARMGGRLDLESYILTGLQRRNAGLALLRLLATSHGVRAVQRKNGAAAVLTGTLSPLYIGPSPPPSFNACPRTVSASIHMLRLLRALVAGSPLHQRTLAKLGAPKRLQPFLSVEEPTLKRNALLVIKACYRYADVGWVRGNQSLVSDIFMAEAGAGGPGVGGLLDDWCSRDQYGMQTPGQWREREAAALAIRRRVTRRRLQRRYGPLPPAQGTKQESKQSSPDAESYMKRLFDQVELPVGFASGGDREWVENFLLASTPNMDSARAL